MGLSALHRPNPERFWPLWSSFATKRVADFDMCVALVYIFFIENGLG
jgi:hypothetical protein